MKSLKKLINNCTSMEILEIETTKERETYLQPKISFVALEDDCMVFTSLQAHQTEPVVPIEEEEDGGIPDEPKGAKSFDVWETDLPDGDVSFTFKFNE